MIIDTTKPRERWFQQPSVSEKTEKGKILRLHDGVKSNGVIEAVMNLGKNQTLIIPRSYHIFPETLFKGGKEVEIFDIYEGKNIPSDKKSVAFHLVLEDSAGTLTDEVVEKELNAIRNGLIKVHDVTFR